MKLPSEVWCEIMGHLDLSSLISLLRAYRELRGLVALLTDFEIEDLQLQTHTRIERIRQHSIREVLPDLAVYDWKALATRTKTAPVKIVEIALTMEPPERFSIWRKKRSGALPEWVIWERLDVICAHLDRHCFVRLVGAPGMDVRHIKLGQACERVGAKLESSFIECLDFEFTVNKRTPITVDILSQLKSVHIHGLHTVELDTLPSALCLFVELERPVNRRAILRLNSATRLRGFTVHYKGTRVPEVQLGSDVFAKVCYDEPCSGEEKHYECDLCQGGLSTGNMFELVCSRDSSVVSRDNGSHYHFGQASFEHIENWCCCVVLDGVPDWVLLLLKGEGDSLRGLVWKRWESSGPRLITRATNMPVLREMRTLQFFTDIKDYVLPRFLPEWLEKLVLHTTSHGLGLNYLLNRWDCSELLQSVTVIAPPYSTNDDPILFTMDHLDWTVFVKNIYTEGHIEYEWFDLRTAPDEHFMDLVAGRMDLSTHINNIQRSAVTPFRLESTKPQSTPLYMVGGESMRPWRYWHLSAPSLEQRGVAPHYSVRLTDHSSSHRRKIVVGENLKVTFNGFVLEPNLGL